MKRYNNSIFSIVKTIYPYYIKLIPLILVTVLFSSSKLFTALIYEYILNFFGNMDNTNLLKFGIASVLLIIISTSGYYFFILWRRKLKQEILSNLQSKKIIHKKNQDLETWECEDSGSWMTYMTSDAEIISDFIPHVMITVILGFTQFTFAIIYGFTKSWIFTLVIIVATFLSAIIPSKIMPKIEKKRMKIQEDDSTVKGFFIDTLSKIPIIKSLNATDLFVERFKKIYIKFAYSTIDNVKVNSKMNSLNIGVGFTVNALWMSVGVYLISINQLNIGEFVGFITLSTYFNYPFFELGGALGKYSSVKSAFDRFFSSMKTDSEKANLNQKIIITQMENDSFRLYCENIGFRYKNSLNDNKETPYVFEKVSFSLEKDDRIFLKGKNGSGKSTILKNIMGLYSVVHGEVSLAVSEGNNKGGNMLDYFSYVPQGNSLFTDTIRENLLYGNSTASDRELLQVLKLTGSWEFVNNLPDGLNTKIGEGARVQLSEGQSQRIAISRALLKEALILCLDEITSALDSETEKKVLNNLKNKAYILISHNEKNEQYCNKILFLDK